MGKCCSISDSSSIKEVYPDFSLQSLILRFSNDSGEKIPLPDSCSITKDISISEPSEGRFFITGGKSSSGFSKSCLEVRLLDRSIKTRSPLDQGSHKGYSFEYSGFLYYVFSVLEKKENNFLLRLSIDGNYWEKLFPKLTLGRERVSLHLLKEAGVTFFKDSLFVVSGFIPRAHTFSNSIFKLNLDSFIIENLGIKLESQIKKPLCFFLNENLIIFHKKNTLNSDILKVDLTQKTIQHVKEQQNFCPKLRTPVYKLSADKVIICTTPKVKFSLRFKELLRKHEKNILTWKSRRWDYISLEAKETRVVEIEPLFLEFSPQIFVNYSTSTVPVMSLPGTSSHENKKKKAKGSGDDDRNSVTKLSYSDMGFETGRNQLEENPFRESQVPTVKQECFKSKSPNFGKEDHGSFGKDTSNELEKVENYDENMVYFSSDSEDHFKPGTERGVIVDRNGKMVTPDQTFKGDGKNFEILLDSPNIPFSLAGSIDYAEPKKLNN
jgi:hypothetical protein